MNKTPRKLISVLLCMLLCLSTFAICASALGETCQVICSHDNALQHGWYRVVFYAHDTYEVHPNPDNAYSPLISFGNPADGFAPFEGDIELERGEIIQIDYFPESGYRLAYLNAIYVTEGEGGSTPQKGNLKVLSDYGSGHTYVLETPTNIGAYSVRIDPVFRPLPAPPVWSWNDDHTAATATFTLDDDDVKTVTDEAPQTNEISAADCENDQVVTFTATVEFDGESYSDTTEQIPVSGTATGHTYGQPVWNWNDDHTAATATFTCGCGDVQTVTDEAPQTNEISAADCENDQVVTFTATVEFDGESYSDTTEQIPVSGTATGHTYGQPVWNWNDDHTAATATFTCGCGDVQTVTDEAPAMQEVSAATATEDQVVIFTASVTFNGQSYSDATESITVEGTATVTPDEEPTQTDEPAQNTKLCKWCHKDHSGSVWQRVVGFFHTVLYFWAHLFGLR